MSLPHIPRDKVLYWLIAQHSDATELIDAMLRTVPPHANRTLYRKIIVSCSISYNFVRLFIHPNIFQA
ncbi:hypothetical protein [Prevotella fusca]|uniref:hypothetical protein n=1 Tax=Prevotella fusca TaxID=589436 RepID=UPI000688B07C|nr:hypothetical protein [Prevotella fusca]